MPTTTPPRGLPLLRRRTERKPQVSILFRALAVLGLIGIALAGHWFDRDGLKDNTDGSITFLDVVYFTAITVTTVGYGDIVPVTDRARMFDTFVVTPIRLFIWFIFLGSAYSFVLKDRWDRFRMTRLQRMLNDHTIIAGYGSSGAEVAAELLRRGCPPERIVVVDCDASLLASAMELGMGTIHGDATRNAVLRAAAIARARSVIVTPGRDDTAVLIVLTARRLAPMVSISAKIDHRENEELARDAGADTVINPVSFGGQLLASTTLGAHVAAYVSDLVTGEGRVLLRERPVVASEIGRPLSALAGTLGLRILRAGREIGFWEAEADTLCAGDVVVEVVPVGVG